MNKNVIIVGAGFSGLSLACYLGYYGFDVTVIEKHAIPGGRARQFSENGFTFDMGPSWYWMPEVFEDFFTFFNKNRKDYYSLQKLDPSYRVFWEDDFTDIPSDFDRLCEVYENFEKGSSRNLKKLIHGAKTKYDIGMCSLAKKPGLSVMEFVNKDVFKNIWHLGLLGSLRSLTQRNFSHPKLRMLFEFPILFLGALPKNTPALYSLMNYADTKLSTWYPKGGFHSVVKAMEKLAKSFNVKFLYNTNILSSTVEKKILKSVQSNQNKQYNADVFVFSSDYHYVEKKILPKNYQNHSDAFWQRQKMAPSAILYYLGLDRKIPNLLHHNLFFDRDFELHAQQLYSDIKMPTDPLFYVNVPSKTDNTLSPSNAENIFILMPIASGIFKIDKETKNKYLNVLSNRIKKKIGIDIREHIVYRKDYTSDDFYADYNAYKGNAYGLANTLLQTSIFKPKCIHKKIKNVFYAGQLTVPGPGVPPSIISGEIVSHIIKKKFM